MKTDAGGCSTCRPGEEHWEAFTPPYSPTSRVQYDYRTPEGVLFSYVVPTLDEALLELARSLNTPVIFLSGLEEE